MKRVPRSLVIGSHIRDVEYTVGDGCSQRERTTLAFPVNVVRGHQGVTREEHLHPFDISYFKRTSSPSVLTYGKRKDVSNTKEQGDYRIFWTGQRDHSGMQSTAGDWEDKNTPFSLFVWFSSLYSHANDKR